MSESAFVSYSVCERDIRQRRRERERGKKWKETERY